MGVVKVLAKLDKLFILAKEPEKDIFNVVILTPEVLVQEFPKTVSGSSVISLQCNEDELRKFIGDLVRSSTEILEKAGERKALEKIWEVTGDQKAAKKLWELGGGEEHST